ncbi:MAG: Gfo/Idh/MocA family oxidoreductase [Verrucomicrobiae bacterium]|nr:Gfo/Idh/MocA family oxidoreductase [Verrucomicrobiae bacterium]
MNQKLKIGIIGTGTIGRVHADAYAANPAEAQIEALCDVRAEAVAAEAEKYKVPQQFTDYRQLLKSDVDAVSVCVGNALHRDVAVAALKAGKHVLLEKPMAMNSKEAAEIVAAMKKSGKVLQIGMVTRQHAEVQLARKMVEEGVLGDVYHIRVVLLRRRGIPGMGGWFTTKSMSGGGPLIDVGVHYFDAAMFVAGLWNPTAVSSNTYAKFGPLMKKYRYVSMWAGPPNFKGVFDVEDYATGYVRFGKAASMSFEVSWAVNAEDENYIEILGSKAGVRLLDGKPLKLVTEYKEQVADVMLQYQKTPNIFHVQAKKFLAACRREAPPAATAEQGCTVMKLIDAIYESGRKNSEVKIS